MRSLAEIGKIAFGNLAASAIQALTVALPRALQAALDSLDEVSKRARRLQIDPTFLRELEGASELLGIEAGKLEKVIVRIREAAGGLGEKQGTDALEKLGITIEDLADLDAEEQLQAVVSGLENVENATERTAAAVAIAGNRLGQALLDLAATGSDEFRTLIEEQRKFGSDAIEVAGPWAEEWNDAASRVGTALENAFARGTAAAAETVLGTPEQLRRSSRALASEVGERGATRGIGTAIAFRTLRFLGVSGAAAEVSRGEQRSAEAVSRERRTAEFETKLLQAQDTLIRQGRNNSGATFQ